MGDDKAKANGNADWKPTPKQLYQNSQTLTHPAGVLPGHPLQKRTEAQ